MKNIILIVLISLSKFSFGQNPSGCIIVFPYGTVPSYPGIYPNPLGINVPAGQNPDIVGKPAYSNNGSITVSTYSCYRNPNPTSTRECAVRVPNGNSYFWYGGVLAQNYYQCPLDENIIILILLITPLGVVFIRKRFKCDFD